MEEISIYNITEGTTSGGKAYIKMETSVGNINVFDAAMIETLKPLSGKKIGAVTSKNGTFTNITSIEGILGDAGPRPEKKTFQGKGKFYDSEFEKEKQKRITKQACQNTALGIVNATIQFNKEVSKEEVLMTSDKVTDEVIRIAKRLEEEYIYK